MSQFQNLTGISLNGQADTRALYFNSGRMRNIRAVGSTCAFDYVLGNGAIAYWIVNATYATVSAAAANYDKGVKVPLTFVSMGSTNDPIPYTETAYVDCDNIVYAKNNTLNTLNTSWLAIDEDRLSLSQYVANITFANLLTLLNATGGTGIAATVTVLRAGTNNGDFVSSKTLKDAGLTFAATTILALAGGSSNQLAITTTAGAQGFTVVGTAQTANDLCTISATTAVASAALMKAIDVTLTSTGASAINTLEAARFTLSSNVKMGDWANAVCAKIDLNDSGHVTGLAGVVCAELQLPIAGVTGGAGTYGCFEAEIGMDGVSNGAGVSAMVVNVWGAQKADFDTKGFLFDITGVTKGTTKFYQDNNNAATQAVRCRINGEVKWLLFSDTSD